MSRVLVVALICAALLAGCAGAPVKDKPMDARKWYEKPMRIAALQCNFEKDSFAVLDTWRADDFNTEQLLHLFGEGYYGAFREEQHGEALKKYLEKARGLDIRVIVYANTHTLPHSMPDKDPEWAARNPDGSYKKAYETHLFACPNSPWTDWMLAEIRRLAAYEIDGVFSDGPAGACYCAHCAKAFRAKYGCPLPQSAESGSPQAAALRDFDLDTRVQFMKRFYEAIKSVRPEALCYQNLDVFGYPTEKFLPYNDLVGSEGGFLFYGPPQRCYLWKTSLRAKALEGSAQGKPTVIFAAGDQKSWSCYLHAPGETTLMYAASVANGASVWYGLHCPVENMNRPGGQAAIRMNHFHAKHETWYDATKSAANVAILNSMSTRAHYQSTRELSDFYSSAGSGAARGMGNIDRSTEGFAAMLYRNQIPFDFVSEEALIAGKADQYRCLVLPTCACMSDDVVQAIRTFVQNGGLLIASLDTSLFDGSGKRRDDFGLADVFGASLEQGGYALRDFNYIEFTGTHPLLKNVEVTLAQAPDFGLKVRETTAEVIARYHEPLPGRYEPMTPLATPAVLWNSFGKGHCLFLPGTFGEFYWDFACREYGQLVVNAIGDSVLLPVRVANAPESLEITIRKKADGSAAIVHLINYTGGMIRPIQESVPLHDVQVHVSGSLLDRPVRHAKALTTGKRLSLRKDGDSVLLSVPEIREYEVVVLE